MSLFLVGGYTPDSEGEAQGVGLARRGDDGRLEYLGVVARTASPSWNLVVGDVLLSVDESAGAVVGFDASDGELREVGRADVDGDGPCHLEFADGFLFASCYGSGSVSVHPVDAAGAPGESTLRIQGEGSGPHPDQPHARAHATLGLPDGRLLIADLGADRVTVHGWRDGRVHRITEIVLPAGTGPRDLALLADGRVLLLGELDSTLHLIDPNAESDPDAPPAVISSVAIPGAGERTHAAGLAIDADRGRIHIGLRRANRIGVVDLRGDELVAVGDVDCGGDWPRHLVLDGDLLHVANQLSSTIATFRVGGEGLPEPLGAPTSAPSPTHLLPIAGRVWERLRPLLS